MHYYSYELDQLVRQKKCVPYQYPTMKYKVGVTYWCGYWARWYKVLEVNGRKVMIKWSDGKVAMHTTSIDPFHDYELRGFPKTENPVNEGESYTFAQIKAMCCAGVIPADVTEALVSQYMTNDIQMNDKVYYFIRRYENKRTGQVRIFLKRDLEKSPKGVKLCS